MRSLWIALTLAVVVRGAHAGSYAIPPGREQAVLALLGNGKLPGDCDVGDVSVKQSVIEVHYVCKAGALAVELHHPSDTGATTIGIVPRGTPPPGFVDALAARFAGSDPAQIWSVRLEREGDPPAGPPRASTGAGQPHGFALTAVLISAAALLLIFLSVALQRRRSRGA